MSDLVETPYVLFGSKNEILHHLRANRDRWGITRDTVRTEALDALAPSGWGRSRIVSVPSGV